MTIEIFDEDRNIYIKISLSSSIKNAFSLSKNYIRLISIQIF